MKFFRKYMEEFFPLMPGDEGWNLFEVVVAILAIPYFLPMWGLVKIFSIKIWEK